MEYYAYPRLLSFSLIAQQRRAQLHVYNYAGNKTIETNYRYCQKKNMKSILIRGNRPRVRITLDFHYLYNRLKDIHLLSLDPSETCPINCSTRTNITPTFLSPNTMRHKLLRHSLNQAHPRQPPEQKKKGSVHQPYLRRCSPRRRASKLGHSPWVKHKTKLTSDRRGRSVKRGIPLEDRAAAAPSG